VDVIEVPVVARQVLVIPLELSGLAATVELL
jgi:hypothetical protein